jgi:hypothetical protein
MAYRVVDPLRPFFDNQGRILSGGELRFYEAGTTTPKSVYADQDLSVDNGSTIALDSAGRPDDDVWGAGSYRVRVYDSAGVLIEEADPVSDPAASSGAVIPALQPDEFLTNDGSNLVWEPILQVPDPTGSSGKVLGTDGANLVWQSLPEVEQPADPDVTVAADSFRAGTSASTTKFLIQRGSATAPASGSNTTQASVTFPVPFDTVWHVSIMPTTNSQPGGPVVWNLTAAPATTGFTAQFDVAEGTSSGANIVNPVPFTWVAFGTKIVTS